MKLKALLLALFAAGFAVSIAVAASPAMVEKGKPSPIVAATTGGTTTASTTTTTTGTEKGRGHAKKAAACKPSRKIVLRGEFVAAGVGGFAMTVSGGNRPAKAWKGKQATVLVDDKTKFRGKKRSLATLAAGDRLNVQGYACEADAAAGSVHARKVMSKGPKDDKDDDDDDEKTTATTTGVTTTTP